MAGAMKLAFVLTPRHSTAQVRTAMPEGQHPAIGKPRDEEAALRDVADRAGLKFVRLPGDNFAAESARLDTRLKELEQRRPRLPEQTHERSPPRPTQEFAPRDDWLGSNPCGHMASMPDGSMSNQKSTIRPHSPFQGLYQNGISQGQ